MKCATPQLLALLAREKSITRIANHRKSFPRKGYEEFLLAQYSPRPCRSDGDSSFLRHDLSTRATCKRWQCAVKIRTFLHADPRSSLVAYISISTGVEWLYRVAL